MNKEHYRVASPGGALSRPSRHLKSGSAFGGAAPAVPEICGTCPTNQLSALRLLAPFVTSTNATVTWQSVAGVNYFLERSTKGERLELLFPGVLLFHRPQVIP